MPIHTYSMFWVFNFMLPAWRPEFITVAHTIRKVEWASYRWHLSDSLLMRYQVWSCLLPVWSETLPRRWGYNGQNVWVEVWTSLLVEMIVIWSMIPCWLVICYCKLLWNVSNTLPIKTVSYPRRLCVGGSQSSQDSGIICTEKDVWKSQQSDPQNTSVPTH